MSISGQRRPLRTVDRTCVLLALGLPRDRLRLERRRDEPPSGRRDRPQCQGHHGRRRRRGSPRPWRSAATGSSPSARTPRSTPWPGRRRGRSTREARPLLPGLYDSHVHPLGAAIEREGPPDPRLRVARRRQGVHRRAGEGPAQGDLDRRPLRLPDPARARAASRPAPSSTRSLPTIRSCTRGARRASSTRRRWTLSGITRDTPDPPAGRIVKDPATGEPTGMLRNAYSVLKGLPEDAYADDGERRPRARQGPVPALQHAGADAASPTAGRAARRSSSTGGSATAAS